MAIAASIAVANVPSDFSGFDAACCVEQKPYAGFAGDDGGHARRVGARHGAAIPKNFGRSR
jgi:hypothetical protein